MNAFGARSFCMRCYVANIIASKKSTAIHFRRFASDANQTTYPDLVINVACHGIDADVSRIEGVKWHRSVVVSIVRYAYNASDILLKASIAELISNVC